MSDYISKLDQPDPHAIVRAAFDQRQREEDIVRCRCHPAYRDRGMQDPDCECDSAEAVQAVADRIEQLAATNEELSNCVAVLEAKLSKSEALLAKAVDVMEWALECWDQHEEYGVGMNGDWVQDARTTLAELTKERSDEKGDTDE